MVRKGGGGGPLNAKCMGNSFFFFREERESEELEAVPSWLDVFFCPSCEVTAITGQLDSTPGHQPA